MNQAATCMPDGNPFATTRDAIDSTPNPAFDASLRNVIDRIVRAEPLIPLIGEPGTGKTMLLTEIERRLGKRATVRRLQSGDMLSEPIVLPDLLLVDEAERADLESIERVFAGGWQGTLVLACARDCMARLPTRRRSRPEHLRALRSGEARALARARLARAGQSGLVASKALDELAKASRGNLRALVQLGGAAVFFAREDGSNVVRAEHVRAAVQMRGSLDAGKRIGDNRSRVRAWPNTSRLPAVVRGHRAEMLAGAGAVFALVLMMLGGVGTERAKINATVAGQAETTASPSMSQLPAGTQGRSERVEPDAALASSTSELSPKIAGGPATRAATKSEPPAIPIYSRAATREAAAIQSLIAKRPSLAAAATELASARPVYDQARLTPSSALPLPIRQDDRVAPSSDVPAVLAMTLPAAPPVAVATPPTDTDQPVDRVKQMRTAEIKARDALREMRIARGG